MNIQQDKVNSGVACIHAHLQDVGRHYETDREAKDAADRVIRQSEEYDSATRRAVWEAFYTDPRHLLRGNPFA